MLILVLTRVRALVSCRSSNELEGALQYLSIRGNGDLKLLYLKFYIALPIVGFEIDQPLLLFPNITIWTDHDARFSGRAI